MSTPYKGQDYQKLKKECLRSGKLFEDDEFPAIEKNLFFSQRPPRPFEWKRPHEIVDNPAFFVGGASRFDIEQGMLGDCWFLAAVASLSLNQNLHHRVCPPDQSFSKDYAGIFHFQFWQYGDWVDIVVDDRLPTYNGELVFVHSKEKNEFWSALMEKAYAKLNGSYEALKGGNVVEAMADFTGGVAEAIDLREKTPKKLFKTMMSAFKRSSQMGCSIEAVPGQTEAKQANGLICGHAYTITAVTKVKLKTHRGEGDVRLVRVRNPWGQSEWNGPWSDESREWSMVSASEKKSLGLETEDDGEFWMEFRDFTREFMRLDICNLPPGDVKSKKRYDVNATHGRWQKNCTAGGCRNFPDTFWINPQVRLSLEEEDGSDDEDDEDEEPGTVKLEGGSTFIVSLMQKNRRKQKRMGIDNLTIGFSIYELKNKDKKLSTLPKEYFLYNASKARSNTFINTREICGRFTLPKGEYCIIPSTFNANEEGDFVLRIYSLKKSQAKEHDEETGVVELPKEAKQPTDTTQRPTLTPEQQAAFGAQEEKFREFFQKLTGDDMEVDSWELQEILNAALRKELHGSSGFTLESCKSMVALNDLDRSGKLGFNEFKTLWRDITRWKGVFKKFDRDNSGTFNAYELRMALRSVGYTLSAKTFSALVLRYGGKEGTIDFDDFIQCTIKLKNMFETFNNHSQNGKESSFKLDEFLQMSMYS
ncbi:calpain-B-like isoform X2 [Anneissia japonica]|uniref:calpain-B-like isoform X2 n=1 Tax=Anneissia japonica TaxID=1529436 RepID=UPI00142554EF|nr:calpain-B-like isoform X2 [Anneissia japonica]